MADRKIPSTIAEAKRKNSSTYRPKTGHNKGKIIAAVSKEELEKSGLTLRDYLNKQQGKTRRTAAKVAPRPKARPAPAPKKYVGSDQRPDNRPVKSTPKSKPKTPKDILGTKEQSRARRRARQEAKTKKDTSMTPEQKLKGQIGIGAAAAALIAPVALPILMKVATKHGPAFARSLGNKIKNLTSGQQKDVLKTAAQEKMTSRQITEAINNATSGSRGRSNTSVNLNNVVTSTAQKAAGASPMKSAPFRDIAKLNAAAARRKAAAAAARAERKRKSLSETVSSSRIPGAKLRKKGGFIKKYNKGGKVVKRKEGGQVMSGNDLVSSLYN